MTQLYGSYMRKAVKMFSPFAFNRHSTRIYVKDTGTAKGRGVYAAETIEVGEVIEECPVVQLTSPFGDFPIELRRIIFDWEDLAGMKNIGVIALGFGSLYNHDNPAKARYQASEDGIMLHFIANERIEKDTEITINYMNCSGMSAPGENEWFRMAGIDPF